MFQITKTSNPNKMTSFTKLEYVRNAEQLDQFICPFDWIHSCESWNLSMETPDSGMAMTTKNKFKQILTPLPKEDD